MQVKDTLAGARPDVGHQAPAAAVDALRLRHVCRNHEQLRQHPRVGRTQVGRRLDVLAGDQQDMGGSARVHIAECHHGVGGVDDVGGRFPRRDPAEQTSGGIGRHGPNLPGAGPSTKREGQPRRESMRAGRQTAQSIAPPTVKNTGRYSSNECQLIAMPVLPTTTK